MSNNVSFLLPKKKKKFDTKRALFIAAFLVIPTVNLLVFYFWVNFNSILMAFQQRVKGGATIWTLANFSRLFNEGFGGEIPIIKQALTNTLTFFSVGFFFVNPLTLIFAYFFYKRIKFYKFYRLAFFLPSIIPGTVMVTLFRYILAPDGSGLFAYAFSALGMNWPNLLGSSQYALKTIIAFSVWTGFGVNLILFTSAMSRIPTEVMESAQLDGIGMTRELCQFVVPLIWPTISTVLLLAVMSVFTATGPIMLFTRGNYGTYTLAYWIFEQVNTTKNFEYASAVGLFFTMLGLPIVIIVRYIMKHLIEEVEY